MAVAPSFAAASPEGHDGSAHDGLMLADDVEDVPELAAQDLEALAIDARIVPLRKLHFSAWSSHEGTGCTTGATLGLARAILSNPPLARALSVVNISDRYSTVKPPHVPSPSKARLRPAPRPGRPSTCHRGRRSPVPWNARETNQALRQELLSLRPGPLRPPWTLLRVGTHGARSPRPHHGLQGAGRRDHPGHPGAPPPPATPTPVGTRVHPGRPRGQAPSPMILPPLCRVSFTATHARSLAET